MLCRSFQGRPAEADNSAHNNLGLVYLDLRCWTEALACFEKAKLRKPVLAGVFHNLGVALQALGRDLEASDAYRQAVNFSPVSLERLAPCEARPLVVQAWPARGGACLLSPGRHTAELGLRRNRGGKPFA